MNIPDMAKVLNHLRRDPVVKVTHLLLVCFTPQSAALFACDYAPLAIVPKTLFRPDELYL